MKTYEGTRTEAAGGATVIVRNGEAIRGLDPRHDLWNPSPDGFQWGYGGRVPR